MIFYLGTHQPNWLYHSHVPLFVSARRLRAQYNHSRALTKWALDSGGFSELSIFGKWKTSARQYAAEVWRWSDSIGNMEWAAQQDWMCEPFILNKTGLSIETHQNLTTDNYVELMELTPHIQWIPVLQGWEIRDYLRHFELYKLAGIDLLSLPIVGLGSMCRRQGLDIAKELVELLWSIGLKIHLFGFKITGLKNVAKFAVSSDSMAWSVCARRGEPLPVCKHKKCVNCIKYAMAWRNKVMSIL